MKVTYIEMREAITFGGSFGIGGQTSIQPQRLKDVTVSLGSSSIILRKGNQKVIIPLGAVKLIVGEEDESEKIEAKA